MVRRIVGGEEVSIEDRPYLVSVQFRSQHHCGGSIITSNLVLTAAHCLIRDPQYYSIRSGSTYHQKGGTIHQIKQFIKHESGDIALVEVCKPFKFDYITCAPIKMFKQGEKSNEGTWAVVSGWGFTIENGTCLPDKLRSVSMPIVDRKVCATSYRKICNVTIGQICAGFINQGEKDACQKDSGGPLTINGILAGIVSKGRGCGRAYYPGIYTEVAFYKTWINKKIWILEENKKAVKCSL